LGAGTVEAQYRLNCVLYTTVLAALVIDLSFRIWYDRKARSSGAVA